MARFFRDEYAVGRETVTTGIPWLILLEIITQAALVLKTCILGSLEEEQSEKIRKHPFYRFGFEYPLRFIYSLVLYERQRPMTIRALYIALVGASIACAIADIYSAGEVFKVAEHYSLLRIFLFAVLPLIILANAVRRIMRYTWIRLITRWGPAAIVLLGTAGAAYWASRRYEMIDVVIAFGAACAAFLLGIAVRPSMSKGSN